MSLETAEPAPSTEPANDPWIRTSQALSALLAGLVLMQSALAGQFLYTATGMRAAHRTIGEGLGLLGVALVVTAAKAWQVDRARSRLLVTAVSMLVVLVAQTGLGFVGRDTPDAAALHVPLGVVAFAIAEYAFMLSRTMSAVANSTVGHPSST